MLPINQRQEQQQDTQTQNIRDYLLRLYIQTPLSTKLILKLSAALFLVQRLAIYFDIDFVKIFATSPEQTISNYKLFTFLISPMVATKYLSIIVNCFFFYEQSHSIERAKGSLSYLLDFFIKCILIQIVFLVLVSTVSPLFSSDKVDPKFYGLFPFCIYLLTLKTLKDGNKPCLILFTPFQIRQKFYLALLLILKYLFTKQISDFVSAVLVGALQIYVIRKDILGFIIPTLETTSFLYTIRQNLTGYISYDQREEIFQMLNEENKLDIQGTISRYDDFQDDVLINNFSQNSKPNSNNNSNDANNSSDHHDKFDNNNNNHNNKTITI
ncbi:hypothetical protein ABPG72_014742 [Tetrahymena utriculariae]